ncbi:MAG: SDR family NAD(P)-dependent oxidoreductase [Bacteroidetes bacterium]|nr:SDR family NAD(P)-dependent oxidoreductase [Bacteroidota bacterium]
MENLSQKVILITGSTDGLGKLVAQRLAAKGATLLLHGRSPDKGLATLDEIHRLANNVRAQYYNADLSSLKEVRELGEKIIADQKRLDVLINNAGIGGGPRGNSKRELSKDGIELRFAVNYLSHFLLTYQLLPLLRASAPSRIINVSSIGQYPLDFKNLMLEKKYESFRAYRQSKLAQIMFTMDLYVLLFACVVYKIPGLPYAAFF